MLVISQVDEDLKMGERLSILAFWLKPGRFGLYRLVHDFGFQQ